MEQPKRNDVLKLKELPVGSRFVFTGKNTVWQVSEKSTYQKFGKTKHKVLCFDSSGTNEWFIGDRKTNQYCKFLRMSADEKT